MNCYMYWVPLIGLQQWNETGSVGEVDETMLCAGQTGKYSCQESLVLLYDQFLDKLVWMSACTYCNQDSAFSSSIPIQLLTCIPWWSKSNTEALTNQTWNHWPIKHGITGQSNTEALTDQTRNHWSIKHGITDQSNTKALTNQISNTEALTNQISNTEALTNQISNTKAQTNQIETSNMCIYLYTYICFSCLM